MRILLLGAAGFIGRELLAALVARGHEVHAVVRARGSAPLLGAAAVLPIDLNHATREEQWLAPLAGCAAVVNCAGILQATSQQSIEAIHRLAPIALFKACERAGVRLVVQISAISAERSAPTPYARTKLAADDYLRSTTLEWTVVRPSLVIGRGAHGGTALLRALAALPFAIPVPRGDGAFQPIHVDDLARVVAVAIETGTLVRKTIDPVGPEVVTLARLLEDYRRWLGLAAAPVVPVPDVFVRAATALGDRFGGPMNSTARAQLAFGNTGDHAAFERAAGFPARGWSALLASQPSHTADRWHARLYFIRPLLRVTLAALWFGSAVAGALAVEEWSARLAQALPLGKSAAGALLAALCAADFAIGIALLARWRPRLLALVQVAMIGGYTVAASILWPQWWLHPLGVLLKNVPIVAAALALGAIEEESR